MGLERVVGTWELNWRELVELGVVAVVRDGVGEDEGVIVLNGTEDEVEIAT